MDILLRALEHVPDSLDVKLLVVGEFWSGRRETEELIQALELSHRVQIVDRYVPNEELGAYFSAADLVVQPYRSGTGSGVAQLAFGFQRPVLATRVGSLPEVIREGIDGWLVPPEDPVALASALEACLEPETLQTLKNGASTAGDRFSWARYVTLVLEGE